MLVGKIGYLDNSLRFQNKRINKENQHKNTDNQKNNKQLSRSAKYMIGTTALVGTIAFLTIGNKRGWFKSNKNEIVDYGNDLANIIGTIPDII